MDKTLLLGLLVLALPGAPAAGAAPPDQAGNCQASPLREAIRTGALTERELKVLEVEREAIRARYRVLGQPGTVLDEQARAELDDLRAQLHAKAAALAANDERDPPRSAPPARFCGPRAGKAHGRMPPPAGLDAGQLAQWEQDRVALAAKVQAARADGWISAQEREQIRARRDAMQRKYHAVTDTK